MDNAIKLNKTSVAEDLQKIQKMIDVSESDLKAFESVSSLLLTPQNIASSKKLRDIADSNDEKRKKRQQAIQNAVANLKIAYKSLTEYSQAMGM